MTTTAGTVAVQATEIMHRLTTRRLLLSLLLALAEEIWAVIASHSEYFHWHWLDDYVVVVVDWTRRV